MQLITFQNFHIQTCFSQFLWFFSLKCWFKGQMMSRVHLSLPNAYKLMCFDRIINGNTEIGMFFWVTAVTALEEETHFSLCFIPKFVRNVCLYDIFCLNFCKIKTYYLFKLISSRNSLDEIYFGRTRDVVNSLRSIQPLGEVEEREKKRKGILADLVAMNKKRAIDI